MLATAHRRLKDNQMSGVNWVQSTTLWLNITNLPFGVVILVAVLLVAGAVGWEVVFKHRRDHQTVGLDAGLSIAGIPAVRVGPQR